MGTSSLVALLSETIWDRTMFVRLLIGLTVTYFLSSWFYNLFLHPLRGIPGPKLAAMTSLYEFWFDAILDGRYLFEVEKMHEKYGPVVRVNPREVHIRDPQYYNTVYSASHKVEKDAITVNAFAVPRSTVSTIDHFHHRDRRSYINPFFTKKYIQSIETVMHERINKLCHRLEMSMETGKLMTLDSAFSALTADIITSQCFGEHFDYLDEPNFKNPVVEAFLGVSNVFHFARAAPSLVSLLRRLPLSIVQMLAPSVAQLLELQIHLKKVLENSLGESKKEQSSIMTSIMNNPSIPPAERDLDRMVDEGTLIIFGGTETLSRALSVGMFYLLRDEAILKKLREELSSLPFRPDNDYSFSQLEQLPYLSGVVNEGVRLAFGPVGRLPRVAVDKVLQYNDITIPPGTPVSLSTYFVHTDPNIYPDPWKFDPERWIRATKEGVNLNKYLTSFTKGSRQCIGISFAMSEMYLTMVKLVRTFEMEIRGTTTEHIKIHHARMIAYPKKEKNATNIRGEIIVKVTGRASMA